MLKIIALLLLLLFASGCVQKTLDTTIPHYLNNTTAVYHTNLQTPQPTQFIINETPYPIPTYIPSIREWHTDTISGVIIASNPSSYITPENAWVRYYASQLYVDNEGRIRYKNTKSPWVVDSAGKVLMWIDKPFVNNYTFDIYKKEYGYVDVNDVPWLMPDFYLVNGQRGVCSTWAVTMARIMLSGELSIKNGNLFVKQIIPAKVVIGRFGNKNDAWVEYSVYNKTFITSTGMSDGSSQTWFLDKNSDQSAELYKPVFEFTNKYFIYR